MAESTGQTRISRYIGLYSAESTITHAKSSLRLFLGSALGRKVIPETLEAAREQYFAERRDYQTDVETFFKINPTVRSEEHQYDTQLHQRIPRTQRRQV